MVYRVIGIMSGSSLDGLDIVFTELHENGGKWNYEIVNAACYSYPGEWTEKLRSAISLNAFDYQLLHTEYGHYIGQQVNRFIEENELHYKAALISSHGHTTFHIPAKKMTAQLGDGASIAAETGLPVVTDLRSLDIALGGQGAPIVPIGEKLLLGNYDYFLNLGGIANISFTGNLSANSGYIAFDVCPANRVLNMLAYETGKEFDEEGLLASYGTIQEELLKKLNSLDYYSQPYPKSLANDFGTDTVYPMIKNAGINVNDALATYVEHIAIQIEKAITTSNNNSLLPAPHSRLPTPDSRLLATGGGVFNTFLVERISNHLQSLNIELTIPDENLVKYKEALIMALIGVLRWRQEYTVLSSVTGTTRDSIGGALWNGQEA
jgi:anhydro-N-acetylmuramic acid kinase